jgi:hypothetical protein
MVAYLLLRYKKTKAIKEILMSMLKIDKNYKGIIPYDNHYIYNGTIEELDVAIIVITVPLTVEGSMTCANIRTTEQLEVRGSISCKELTVSDTLIVSESLGVDNNLNVKKDVNIGGYLDVGGDTFVGGSLTINECAKIRGRTYIEGSALIKKDCILNGYDSSIAGSLTVGSSLTFKYLKAKELSVFGKRTKRYLQLVTGDYHVIITDSYIKIGCELYSVKRLKSLADSEIKNINKDIADWWKVWGDLMLSIHTNIPKIY